MTSLPSPILQPCEHLVCEFYTSLVTCHVRHARAIQRRLKAVRWIALLITFYISADVFFN